MHVLSFRVAVTIVCYSVLILTISDFRAVALAAAVGIDSSEGGGFGEARAEPSDVREIQMRGASRLLVACRCRGEYV